jgi:orotate phosphoribosyltransferase
MQMWFAYKKLKRKKTSWGLEFDVLFGPAYKGIPLATAAAMALNDSFNKNHINIRYNLTTAST